VGSHCGNLGPQLSCLRTSCTPVARHGARAIARRVAGNCESAADLKESRPGPEFRVSRTTTTTCGSYVLHPSFGQAGRKSTNRGN
jgi:hypothetical protein